MPPAARAHRCPWAEGSDAYRAYHDDEWGVPVHDDRTFFEFLLLEGAQAGLAWSTILNKRDGYRRAFAGFDPARVARFDERDAARLLADAGIVRNRAKIASAIGNARAFLAVQQEFGSFDAYVWRFVDGRPRQQRVAHARRTYRRRRPRRRPCRRTSPSAASASSARRSSTRSCRPPGWSTTTW